MSHFPAAVDARLRSLGLLPPARTVRIPGNPQDIASVLDAMLANSPDKEALIGRHSRYNYRQLEDAVNAAAAALRSLGVGPGDRVACVLDNHPDLVIAFLAVQRLAAVWVGINGILAAPEKAYLLEDSEASVLLGDAGSVGSLQGLRAKLPDLKHVLVIDPAGGGEWNKLLARHRGAGRPGIAIDPHLPAGIAYTSGTTGRPKGVVHSQHNLMVVAHMRMQHQPRRFADRDGVPLPITILNCLTLGPLTSLTAGCTSICVDSIHATGIAEWIRRERIGSMLFVLPILYDLLTRPEIDPKSLATLTSPGVGAAHIPDAFRQLYRERFGREILFGYGLTEAPTAVTNTIPEESFVPGSSGYALPHVTVRVLDAADREVTAGEVGEVCIREVRDGPWAGVYTPMLGYWKRPDATAQALRNGWLHTGDVGVMDARGNLFIKDRAKEIIVRGGANVYPAEVERVLQSDPRVAACAVFGKPDARLGEIVVAAVQPASHVTDREELQESLKNICAAELARYKQPAEWHMVEDMPRNSLRKIVKGVLREQLLGTAAGSGI